MMDFFRSFCFKISGINSVLAKYKNPPPEKARKNKLNNSNLVNNYKLIERKVD